MSITLRNTSSGTTGGTSITVNVPSGVQNGDVMVLGLYCGTAPGTISGLSGWTLQTSATSASPFLYVYTRVASSEPASYTVTVTNGGNLAYGCLAYTGVNNSNPTDGAAAQDNSASTSVVAPSITTTRPNDQLVVFYASVQSGQMTLPGGETLEIDAAGAGGYRLDVGDEALASAGATGTRTATATASAQNAGALVALQPTATTAYELKILVSLTPINPALLE